MAAQLTQGAINQIWSGQKDFKPILQIIEIRNIGRAQQTPQAGGSQRFRLVLSDGAHYQQGMLVTQGNIVTDAGLQTFCIVQLDQFVCSNVQGRRVIIVLNLTVVDKNISAKIGNPTNIEGTQASPPPQSSPPQQQLAPQQQAAPVKHEEPTHGSPLAARAPVQPSSQHQPQQPQQQPPRAAPAQQAQQPQQPRLPPQQYQQYQQQPQQPQQQPQYQQQQQQQPAQYQQRAMQAGAPRPAVQQPPAQQPPHRPAQQPQQPQQQPQYQTHQPARQPQYQQQPPPQQQAQPQYQQRGAVGGQPRAPQHTTYQQYGQANRGPPAYHASNDQGAISRSGGDHVFPIKSLNPYQNKWSIVGRVTSKKDIKTYVNQRGEGKLFSFDLLDSLGGEIKVTAFNTECDRFFPMVQEGQVYKVSRGSIKPANRRYSSLNSQFEITLDQSSSVEPTQDSNAIPTNNFNFTPLSALGEVLADANVDVIGVVIFVDDAAVIRTKQDKDLAKRELQLVDQTAQVVRLTLWGQQAENFSVPPDTVTVIAVKAARVSEFDGRSLSVSMNSTMAVNPDIPETQQLANWYSSEGSFVELKRFVSQNVGERKFLCAIQEEGLGLDGRAAALQAKVIVAMVNHKNNISYPSCTKCKRKVSEDAGMWRCEKCNLNLPEPTWRYIISIQCKDHTTSQWVSLFDDSAAKLLGKTASELRDLQQHDDDAFESVFEDKTFGIYIISLRTKLDERALDEQRVRVVASQLTPIDFVDESKKLLASIRGY